MSSTSLLLILSIEPYWNWNRAGRWHKKLRICSQSNLIGIETGNGWQAEILRQLSIEPYWNWNLPSPPWWKPLASPLNRTLLELKLSCPPSASFAFLTLNRTLLELKRGPYSRHGACRHELSIEPYWNWNSIFTSMSASHLLSQSNLIGIETGSGCVIVGHSRCSQSNLIGIETKLRGVRGSCYGLSIEPYWNWNTAKVH